ncbi:MAG: NAD-dependent epimerase/dehydratase family protein, partial [Candidatus Shapirobacteria bacterium]|nr:NAD-dependent epimerase/dehydratase family protein [Candidatus Shapirobacteria bacterium]
MRIAILGATGHIAKGLIENFISDTSHQLFLFSRSLASFNGYPVELPEKRVTTLTNDSFGQYKYDAVINCVGVGDPQKVKELSGQIFSITEKFDRLVLNYLIQYPKCRYINFSSGAVYGKEIDDIISEQSMLKLAVNNIGDKDYYAIAKLNSEAKHRSFPELTIVDIRVFSYFSRYINLNAKFLITEILSSILEKKVFLTDSNDIIRDFIGPKDLFNLVDLCLKHPGHLNMALDVYSKKPVKKMQI